MRKVRTRLYKNRSGQATTELAIFGFVLLIVLASLLKYGQVMNKQQEIRMHAFRQALNKAYYGYGGGSGFGGASYNSIKNIHLASPFRDYYDGSQRTGISGGATVLWDPDMMYLSGEQPNTYVEVDGDEKNLGSGARVEELPTDSYVRVHEVNQLSQANNFVSSNSVQASTDERLVTKVKLENGPDVVFDRSNSFSKDESWTTPWK